MTAREFFTRWRREIVRGTFLFAAVLAVGLLIISGVQRARSSVRDLAFNFDGNNGGPRNEAAPWSYATRLAPHQTLWIRNVRGDITVSPGSGDSVRVVAVRAYRHSDPESVRLITASNAEGAAVCAVWGNQENSCTPGHGMSGRRSDAGSSDVRVRFEIIVPPGVNADLLTISGDVKAEVLGSVTASSVQGDVAVKSNGDKVDATTVTGDVSVQLPGVLDLKSVTAKTVTGDVSVELAPGVRAEVSGHTVTGDVTNDFSLPVTGQFASHEMAGKLGNGGGSVRLETITGDVSLGHVDESVLAPVAPEPPIPPAARTHRGGAPRAKTATPPPGTP